MTQQYLVRAEWDSEAQVWVASSDDVPGLSKEGDTIEAIESKLLTMVPDLLEANGLYTPQNYQVVLGILTGFGVSRSRRKAPIDGPV